MAVVGLILIAVGFLPGFFCFPIAMSHMAMPQQWPGWLSPKILPQYFNGMVKPAMYWCMFCVVTMLPTIILVSIAVFGFQKDFTKFVADLNHNARVAHVMSYEEPKNKKASSGEEGGELSGKVDTSLNAVSWWFFATEAQKLSERKFYADQGKPEGGGAALPGNPDDKTPAWEHKVNSEALLVPAILWLVACAPFGFAAVFNIRTGSLFTYYYRPELELISEEKEVVFKRKHQPDELDEHGKPIETSDAGKYAAGVGGTLVFYIVVNVIMYFATGGKYLLLPRPIAKAMNLINNSSTETPPPSTENSPPSTENP